jgi:hypothetical protein
MRDTAVRTAAGWKPLARPTARMSGIPMAGLAAVEDGVFEADPGGGQP